MIPNGARFFYSVNKGLVDDLQELMLKTSWLGIVKQLDRRHEPPAVMKDGREIKKARISYIVYERRRKTPGWLDRRDLRIEPYSGKVYCAS